MPATSPVTYKKCCNYTRVEKVRFGVCYKVQVRRRLTCILLIMLMSQNDMGVVYLAFTLCLPPGLIKKAIERAKKTWLKGNHW